MLFKLCISFTIFILTSSGAVQHTKITGSVIDAGQAAIRNALLGAIFTSGGPDSRVASADIIIGNHPHNIQPVTHIGDHAIVFYALGNGISSQDTTMGGTPESVLTGLIGSVTVTKTDHTSIRICGLHFLVLSYRVCSIQFLTSSISSVHSNRLMTLPLRSTTNLVKFHLISDVFL